MRLLLPVLDKERGRYGMKEAKISRVYLEILNINRESEDGFRLLYWKRPDNNQFAGDFASTIELVMQNRVKKEGVLSVGEINDILTDLFLNKKEHGEQSKLFSKIIFNCSAIEQKWIIRILLKNQTNFGLTENRIFDFFHKDAMRFYCNTFDLKDLCLRLKNVNERLGNDLVELFKCIRPMLAEREKPEKILELIGSEKFFLEVKYDGERIQLHKKFDQFRIFSR